MSATENDVKTFQFEISLDELVWLEGMQGMNDLLDEKMTQAGLGEIATDISYAIIKLNVSADGNENNTVTVEATYLPDEY